MVNSNERLLLFAAKRGATEVCDQVLATPNVRLNVRDEAHKTPLLLACEEGNLSIVNLLLSKGADVHARDPVGMTPLHIATWQGSRDIAKALLAKKADVNARNSIGQTPLHGAALFAHYALVCLLLEHGANPNAQSLARQRLPLHELALRQDKAKERLKIHQLLLERSPDTLYTVFFCKHSAKDVPDWFKRMVSMIYNVNDCRIFYTILQASLHLHLLTLKQAREFAERAFDQCAEYCVTSEEWDTMWLLLNKACVEDQLVRPQFFQMLQEYNKTRLLHSRVVSLDLQASIRTGIRLLRAGVDGDVTTLKNCFLFFYQSLTAMDEQSGPVTSQAQRERATSRRIDTLIGIIGTLLNAILLGRHSHETCFRKLLSRSVDLLDPKHLEDCITRGFVGLQRETLQTALVSGFTAGQKVVHKGDRQWHLDDTISREDGMLIIGMCAAAMGRTLKIDTEPDDTSTGSKDSFTSAVTTVTLAKNVFREDSFLSPDEEDLLKIHKAVKYCDSHLLKEALDVAVKEATMNVVDSVGRTALDLAALTGQYRFFEKIRHVGGKSKYFKSEKDLRKMVDTRSKHVHLYHKLVSAKTRDEGTVDTQSLTIA